MINLIIILIKTALEIFKGERDPAEIKKRYFQSWLRKKDRALNAAEDIFRMTDPLSPNIFEDKAYTKYKKLRMKFDRND